MELEKSKPRALTADYVMVALDTEGKPTGIPSLMLSTEEEEWLYNKARARYQSRKKDS